MTTTETITEIALNTLRNNPGSKRQSKRLGRGIGSGKGKTAGRGVKGQKSRSGVAIKGFEGGQMPLIKRLPKRGFNPITRKRYQPVNISDIVASIDAGRIDHNMEINKEVLHGAALIRSSKLLVKLLGSCNQELKYKLKLKLDAVSGAAKSTVESAGGSVS